MLAILAILAILTREGRGALGVAPGGCALPSPSAPLHGLLFARSRQESRPADRTGKLGLGQGCLDHSVPLGVECHGATGVQFRVWRLQRPGFD